MGSGQWNAELAGCHSVSTLNDSSRLNLSRVRFFSLPAKME